MKLHSVLMLFMLIAGIILLKSCKDHDKLVIDEPNPVDPIDTSSVSKLDCFIGKYEKPDIFFLNPDTTSGVASGYKNCYNFKANVDPETESNHPNFIIINFDTYYNESKYKSYLRETYTFQKIPLKVGNYLLKTQTIPSFRNEDDYIWAAYLLDTSKNNYCTLTSVDTSTRIIKGQISAQFYFHILYNPNDVRTEPDTVRLQEVNFWAKY